MSKGTRYWVVERDEAGDCVGDYLSAGTQKDAFKLASKLSHIAEPATVLIEVGKIVDFEGSSENEQVLRVWPMSARHIARARS